MTSKTISVLAYEQMGWQNFLAVDWLKIGTTSSWQEMICFRMDHFQISYFFLFSSCFFAECSFELGKNGEKLRENYEE